MIKILALEDEREKAQSIVEALLSVAGIESGNVDHCVAAIEAKRLLKKSRYDLFILDVNVPPRLDMAVRVGAGLEPLRAIRNRLPGIIPPEHVLGLTAYDNGFDSAVNDFDNPLWKLIKYDTTSNWRSQVISAANYISKKNTPPYASDGHTYHTTLGIVVALDAVELDSLLALDSSFKQLHVANDPVRYFSGFFEKSDRKVDVVIAAAPRMGMPIAAVVATKLIETFRPRYLAMTGICAGVRTKTKLGGYFSCGSVLGLGQWEAVKRGW